MRIIPCARPIQWFVGLGAVGVGIGICSHGAVIESIPLFLLGAMNAYASHNHAHVKDAKPGELIDLEEIKSTYSCACGNEEAKFVGKIKRHPLSTFQVENVQGEVHNIRQVRGFLGLKKTLVDLVDEDGKAITCVLPGRKKVVEYQYLTLDAYLRKVKTEDGRYVTGLKAYAFA